MRHFRGPWFHGDRSERAHFHDQTWERDLSQSSANENGPGLYFTTSEEEARNYGPYLYTTTLPLTFSFLPTDRRPTMKFLLELYKQANEEDREIFLSNWDARSPRPVLEKYSRQKSFFDAAVSLYGDLIRSPYEWVSTMRALGYDGAVVERSYGIQHLVVWSPERLRIERVE